MNETMNDRNHRNAIKEPRLDAVAVPCSGIANDNGQYRLRRYVEEEPSHLRVVACLVEQKRADTVVWHSGCGSLHSTAETNAVTIA